MTNTKQAERDKAARAMLAALQDLKEWAAMMGGWEAKEWQEANRAIAQAKAAGIET